jgi:hypothetical protein
MTVAVGVVTSRHYRPSGRWGVLVVAAGVALAGCGSPQDVAVRRTVQEFASAVRAGEAGVACDLLALRTKSELEQSAGRRCEEALLEEVSSIGSDVGEVEVFGTAGRVRSGGDVVFVARFRSGWKVSAVGCTPAEGALFDCRVKGS